MSPKLTAHLGGFAAGVFLGAYVYAADRAFHVKGAFNIVLLVVMSTLSLLLGLSVRKVPEGSAYHQPIKWFSVIAGLFLTLAGVYAVVGGMQGHGNFLLDLATGDLLPAGLKKEAQQFVGWSSRNYSGAK